MTKSISTPVPNGDQDEGVALWALADRAQAGDNSAMGELYAATVHRVRAFILARARDRHLADDLTADTYLRAIRSISTLRHLAGSPIAWLYSIARNVTADHYRAAARHPAVLSGDLLELGDLIEQPTNPGPDEVAVTREVTAELWAGVDRLPSPDQRACLRLRFGQGLSIAETASTLTSNVPAIKSLQHRAVRSLRAAYAS